jgi:hypothetical protein
MPNVKWKFHTITNSTTMMAITRGADNPSRAILAAHFTAILGYNADGRNGADVKIGSDKNTCLAI